jgi:heterodisulfide reductase subunit B
MEIELSNSLAKRIQEQTGENVYLCYHCVKCTSGCPLTEFFDLAPNQVMRAAQLGMEDLVFNSRSPWMCASCQTCTTRCPQGLDVARIMDFIVSEAMARGIPPKVPEVALFNKVFLRNVNVLGRASELGLMAEMNLRRQQPFKDLDLGLQLIKHGKLRLLPEMVSSRHGSRLAPTSRPANEVGYYPGCTLHSMASEFDHSTRAVLEALGLSPVEPEGWVCCGSTPAHRVDHRTSVKLPLRNFLLLEQAGLDSVVVPCAACFNRFKTAAHELRLDPALKSDLEAEVGSVYSDRLHILSLLDVLKERVGFEAIAARVRRPLQGLRVACYYGCLLSRPPSITGAEHPEYPMTMDRVVEALGATPIDWDYKVTCCGASLSTTHPGIVLKMSGDILRNARARGADLVAVACPLCHTNLDARQTQMDGQPILPALYLTQLMAVAFGMPEQAALGHNLIDPRPMLDAHGLA